LQAWTRSLAKVLRGVESSLSADTRFNTDAHA
jgi:hypothetical protein